MSTRFVYVLLSLVVAARLPAQTQIRITDGRACPTCRIVLERFATIAGNDTVSFNWLTMVAATSDRFFVGPTYTSAQVAVFDKTGRLVATFGRKGSGPGEFQTDLMRITPGPGDSVHIVDYNRWMVFSPRTHEFARFVRLNTEPTSMLIVGSGAHRGDLLANFPSRRAGQIAAVHLISALTGDIIRSFDRTSGADDEDGSLRSVNWYEGKVWTLTLDRVRIRSESLGGDTITEWRRTDGWFPVTADKNPLQPFVQQPTPKAFHVQPAGELIWLVANTADANWKPIATSDNDPAITRFLRTGDMNTIYDGVIEVIDRRTGNALARLQTDNPHAVVAGAWPLVFRKNMNSDGEITIEVMSVSLRR